MSALERFADSSRTSPEVREVPIPDSCSAIKAQWLDNLLNHLVGAVVELHWHVLAERLGGLEIDHQLELDWGLDGKFARLRALEDAIGIGRRAPKIIGEVTSVGQQAAETR
jgi:hypothetical protein